MLLAFDIGNTNTVIGCFKDDKLLEVLRLQTVVNRTVDEYSALIFPVLERRFGKKLSISHAIISSVVPPVVGDIKRLLEREVGVTPLVIGPGIKTGISIRTKNPAAVGADRIVNALAARNGYGYPAIVIDFGTATSFDVIGKEGDYEGGIIAPGLEVSLNSLVEKTAKLPRIELHWPEKVIGKTTVDAMRSGVALGYQCLVEGLIEKLRDEICGEEIELKSVIATGGLGRIFAEKSRYIDSYEPDLTLKGLLAIFHLNN